VFTLGLALLIDNLEILSLLLLAQPVIRDLSKVCQRFLALEEENRQLAAQLDDVRRDTSLCLVVAYFKRLFRFSSLPHPLNDQESERRLPPTRHP
jgi:hypothetical protein